MDLPEKREGSAALPFVEFVKQSEPSGRLLRASPFEALQATFDFREALLKAPQEVVQFGLLVMGFAVSLVVALAVVLVVALAVVLVVALAVVLVGALAVVLVMAFAVVLVMAFAVFAVLMAIGHFGFHVAKQFFGFFVFALFAQFIDLAFGSLDELTHFLVLFTFVAFALAIAFAVVLMVALAVVGAVTLTAVTLSGRFAGASSCRSSGVFPGSFSGVFPGSFSSVFPGSFSGILPGAVRSFGGPLAFFFTILLLSQSGQDEQADQGKNGQFGLHEL